MQSRTFVSGHMLEGTRGYIKKTYGSVIFGKYIKIFMKKFIFTKIFVMKTFVIFI